MTTESKRKRPEWYDRLSPEAKAIYDATVWNEDEWVEEGETLAMPVRRPS